MACSAAGAVLNPLLDTLLPSLWAVPWEEHPDSDTYGARLGEWGQVWLHTEPDGEGSRWRCSFVAPNVNLEATGPATREGLVLVVTTIRDGWRARVRERRKGAVRLAAVLGELLAWRARK